MTDSHPKTKAPILLTTGEPAGIGPDLVISLLQHPTAPPLWVVADPDLLLERAALLGLPLTLNGDTLAAPGGQATLLPVSVHTHAFARRPVRTSLLPQLRSHSSQ